MKPFKMIEVQCPSCGKEKHSFHVPDKPGIYRLRCQSNNDKKLNIRVKENGDVVADG